MGFWIAEETSMNFLRTRWLFGAALLAAAALGAATLLWLGRRAAAAGRHGLWSLLRGWWEEEIWLGGPFWKDRRETLAQGWFTVTFVLFMLRWILSRSLVPGVNGLAGRLLCDLLFWLMAAKLLLFSRYSLRQLCAMAAVALPLMLACSANGSQFLLYQVLFLLCVKDIDLRRAFYAAFWAVLFITAAIMLLAALGLTPTMNWQNDIRPRNSYGFIHPNSCGMYLLYAASGLLLLWFDRLRTIHWLAMAGLLFVCNFMVDSRACSVAFLLLLAGGAAARYLPRFWRSRGVGVVCVLSPLLLAAVSFLAAGLYREANPFWARLNAFSSGRLELFHMAVSRVPATLFGGPVLDSELYTLDNLYLYNFYSLGIVGGLLYLFLLCAALYQCRKNGWDAETVILLSFAVYGCLESTCWAATTPAVLLFANVIYRPAAGCGMCISLNRAPCGSTAGEELELPARAYDREALNGYGILDRRQHQYEFFAHKVAVWRSGAYCVDNDHCGTQCPSCPASHGRPGRPWLREENWLGGAFAAKQREAMAQGWFTLTFALFMLRFILYRSMIPGISGPVGGIGGKLLCDLLFWLIMGKLLLFTRYSVLQLAAAAAFALPLLLACRISGSQYLLYHILFLFCLKDVDLRKAFRDTLWVVFAAVAAIMLLAALGLIPTAGWQGGARPRNSFGFFHPNICGMYLLYLASGWFLLRFPRLRWRDWLAMAALLFVCSSLVDSRAASLGFLVLMAAGAAARYFPRLWQAGWVRAAGVAAPVLLAAGSFLLGILYRPANPFWERLNTLSSDRLNLFHMAVSRLPITLFGQDPILDEELYALDNMYLANFYSLGIIGSLLYLLLLCAALYQCWKKGWAAETVVLLCLATYGCFEPMCWPSTTPAALLFANVIYRPAPGRELRISRDEPGRADAPGSQA